MSELPSCLKFVFLSFILCLLFLPIFFPCADDTELHDERGVLKEWKGLICALTICTGFCQLWTVFVSPGISNLLLLPAYFLFIPGFHSNCHKGLNFCKGYFIFCKALSSLYFWCVRALLEVILLLRGGNLKMMIEKAREGCSYAKTN